jgi:hypothetical protein
MDTIACEECDDWFHFECLGLTSKNIKKIEEEAPYICKECCSGDSVARYIVSAFPSSDFVDI